MKKSFLTSFRYWLLSMLILGGVYTLIMTGVGQVLFHSQVNGSLVSMNGQPVGSALVAQTFDQDKYFAGRPEGISQLSPVSQEEQAAVDERAQQLLAKNPTQEAVPVDLLTGSGSGVDPHISVEAARFQVDRIAKARLLDPKTLEQLIQSQAQTDWFSNRQYVDVLTLNIALDQQ